jgi:hypothetical protein
MRSRVATSLTIKRVLKLSQPSMMTSEWPQQRLGIVGVEALHDGE